MADVACLVFGGRSSPAVYWLAGIWQHISRWHHGKSQGFTDAWVSIRSIFFVSREMQILADPARLLQEMHIPFSYCPLEMKVL